MLLNNNINTKNKEQNMNKDDLKETLEGFKSILESNTLEGEMKQEDLDDLTEKMNLICASIKETQSFDSIADLLNDKSVKIPENKK